MTDEGFTSDVDSGDAYPNAIQALHHQDAISRVLYALREANIGYIVWGSAATLHHGGIWLWRCQDYEILIKDWRDGPHMRQAIDVVTAHCSGEWLYDHRFDYRTWTIAPGDAPTSRPLWKFRHRSGSVVEDWGIVFSPASDSLLKSRHVNDLENGHSVPGRIENGNFVPYDGSEMSLWVFPTLKNHIESLLWTWNAGRRQSALIEVADLAARRNLDTDWTESVGLELSTARPTPQVGVVWLSPKEMWEEIIHKRY